jgi:hypothetical protein
MGCEKWISRGSYEGQISCGLVGSLKRAGHELVLNEGCQPCTGLSTRGYHASLLDLKCRNVSIFTNVDTSCLRPKPE